jgi:hypothetical protein
MEPSTFWIATQAISATILLWVTWQSVALNKGMLAEMRASRQPSVFVDLELDSDSHVVLIVGNHGKAPARTIRFDLDDRIPWDSEQGPRPLQLPAFRDGIPYLAPGRTLRFHLGHLDWKAATHKGGWLKAEIDFKGEQGEALHSEANINLARYDGVALDTFRTPADKIATDLRDFFYFVRNVEERISITSHSHTWCPSCSKQIPDFAKKCYHCGEWVARGDATGEQLNK